MWSVIYRIGSYSVGSKIHIIWLSFRGTRTWCLTNDFAEQANKSALHDSLSSKTKLFYRFDGFFGDKRPCSGMIEGKRKISWSVHKLKSENVPITNERWLNYSINKYQLPKKITSSGHKTLRSLVFFLRFMIVVKRFKTSYYLFAAVAINLKSISMSSNNINLNSHYEGIRCLYRKKFWQEIISLG